MIPVIKNATVAAALAALFIVCGPNDDGIALTERYSPFGRTTGENCDRDNLDMPGRQFVSRRRPESRSPRYFLTFLQFLATKILPFREGEEALRPLKSPSVTSSSTTAGR